MAHPLKQEFVSGSHFAEQPTMQLIQQNQKKSDVIISSHPKTNEDITGDEENLNTGANGNFTDQVRCRLLKFRFLKITMNLSK